MPNKWPVMPSNAELSELRIILFPNSPETLNYRLPDLGKRNTQTIATNKGQTLFLGEDNILAVNDTTNTLWSVRMDMT